MRENGPDLVKRLTNLRSFALGDVTLEDEYFKQVTQKDVDFLNTFDIDRLLYNFRVTAGVPNKATGPYSGWENTRIGGHTLGHYLAAAAQACSAGYGECKGSDGVTLCERVAGLIDGLAECQAASGTDGRSKSGFIFGATMENPEKPELQFDKLEAGTPADTWVPWYTMHKIMNGLVEVVKLCDSKVGERALAVAEKLGEWIYNRTSRWSDEERNRVLSVEYGAMNDCLYELYKCAKAAGYKDAAHFMEAAHSFDEEKLFEDVLAAYRDTTGRITDVLNNKHANCTIPKFVGAINRCVTLMQEGSVETETVTEQKRYLDYCEAFWTLVTERHTYITGGNSECEHFGRDHILDAERSNCNCETCNTHNMLKLTRTLFMLTGERKYSDYYENTFINAILASVNRETGMTTYFQPMATGCFKTYCNIDVNKNYFWCCTGTGLENFTKLGDSFYFYKDADGDDGEKPFLLVNQYVSSSVKWRGCGRGDAGCGEILISQESKLPEGDTTKITVHGEKEFTLALRIPDWAAGLPQLSLNGTELSITKDDCELGFVYITRQWKDGDFVELKLPMEIRAFNLPDNPKSYAFKYGPVVLAAELGRDSKMALRQVGVQCDVCANKIVRGLELPLNGNYGGTSGLKPLATETLLVDEPVEEFMKNINSHFKKQDALKFELVCGDFSLTFSPYYLINNQRYGIYWLFTDSEEEIRMLNTIAENQSRNTANYIEGIGVGYGTQTEGNAATWPFMEEQGSGSVADPHALWRYAKAGGSFSYMFKVLPDEDKQIYLDCTFLKEDEGKEIRITCGDTVIAEYKVSSNDSGIAPSEEKLTTSFALPKELTNGRKELRICFTGANGKESARLAAPVSTSWK